MAIEVVDRAGGEISAGPITNRILEDGSHTGHPIGLLEVTLPPRTGGPPERINSYMQSVGGKLTSPEDAQGCHL